MNENTNISLTMEAWADIVVKEFIRKISALNISQTYNLVRSFEAHVYTAANGDPEKIIFAFEWYGKFIDYGVGRGVPLKTRDNQVAAGMTKREKKPWFSDIFYKQLSVLRHLLAEKYATKTESLIIRNYEDNADYGYTGESL